VAEAARERAVGRIIVGHPLNADGTEGAFARRARNFARRLSELAGLPVDLHGEGLTSHAAEWNLIEAGVRGGRRDALRDAESAAVLLRDFLFERDSRPRTG
jgi:putative Holliday junction resolvase